MLTPTLATAYDQLKSLDKSIAESESNLRVLAAIGAPEVPQLRAKVAEAINRRADVMAAIEKERENP